MGRAKQTKRNRTKAPTNDREAPPPPRRNTTMQATSKEGKALIKDTVMDSSRSGTKAVKQVLDASTSDAKSSTKKKAKKGSKSGRPKHVIPEKHEEANDSANTNSEGDDEVPPAARRDNTMLVTSKEGKAIIKDSVLDSSRSGTKTVKQVLDTSASGSSAPKQKAKKSKKSNKPATPKRTITISSTVKEAKALFGRKTGAAKATRQLRADTKREAAAPKVKRDDTMTKTAKEGKYYLGKKFLDRMKDTS